MYVGFDALTLAAILRIGNPVVLVLGVYSMVVYHFIIAGEERYLSSVFGRAYVQYRASALTIAVWPADDVHTYGHDKAEYFSAGARRAILVAAITIIYTAIERFRHPAEYPILVLGLVAAWWFRRSTSGYRVLCWSRRSATTASPWKPTRIIR